jgi:hypothetical protein
MMSHSKDRISEQFRIDNLVAVTLLALWLGILPLSETAAAPQLKTLEQPAAGRITPASRVIEDYTGSLQTGFGSVTFIAPGGELRWDAWTHPDHIQMILVAMQIVEQRALGNPLCNRYFRERMPGGRSFDQIWNAGGAQRIRISFSPGNSGTWRAATYPYSAPYEWTITETTVMLGAESIASAMVHEATRTNGIGPEYAVAARAEQICGMQQFMLSLPTIRRLGWKLVKNPAPADVIAQSKP